MSCNASMRARREGLGLTVRDFADVMGVAERTVNRWESDATVPDGVLDELDGLEDAFDRAVDGMVALALEKGRDVEEVRITYWPSQAAYESAHSDGGMFRMANAISREAALRLEGMGMFVDWVYPAEG